MQGRGSLYIIPGVGCASLMQGRGSLKAIEHSECDMVGLGELYITASSISSSVTWLHALISMGGATGYAEARDQWIPPFYSSGDDQYAPPVQDNGFAFLMPFVSYGYAGGASGTGEVYLPSFQSLGGDLGYAFGTGSLQPFVSLGSYGNDYEYPLYSNVFVGYGYGAASNQVIFVYEASTAEHTASSSRLANGVLESKTTINGDLSSQAIRVIIVNSDIGVAAEYAGDRVAIQQFLNSLDMTGTYGVMLTTSAPMTSAIEASNVATVTLSMIQALSEAAALEGLFSSLQDYLESLFSSAVLTGYTSLVRGSGGVFEIPGASDSRTWVVNLDTGASSQYDYYGYNSFIEQDGKYYGLASDGVYLLEGPTDAGRAIEALVEVGKSDFETSFVKCIANVYAGVSSTGRMLLKVSTGDSEYIYEARSSSRTLKNHRFDVGKGLRGNYFNLTLLNQNGCDFDLETITFEPLVLGRKI